MLELHNVSKSYGEQKVLNGISLEIREKELVSIMGKSGVGKSTLLSVLAGLVRPDSGRILFQGQDITDRSEDEWAAFRLLNLGIVFQDFKIFPSLSAYDNVFLATYPRRDVTEAAKREAVSQVIGQVGLENKSAEIAANLSGGEKQRVAIARSLVNRPRLVLADEPTGNLDQKTAGEILELFKTLYEVSSTSFLIITHDPDVARRTQRTYQLTASGLSELSHRAYA